MPVAGDEGYERTVICPYDKAHEIRRGRMQFHLKKCRQNFPLSEKIECPFNTLHRIPKIEMDYHIQEECEQRKNWDSYKYEVGDTVCPVKNLVPINDGIMPECEENWDNEDCPPHGSVLEMIQKTAEDKDIIRLKQCESKAKRKNFRMEERRRHNRLQDETQKNPITLDDQNLDNKPLSRPMSKPESIIAKRQDYESAAAARVRNQFRSLDISEGDKEDNFPSLCSTGNGGSKAPSMVALPSDKPMMSYASMSSRPSTAMSLAMSSATSHVSRPTSAMSSSSIYSSVTNNTPRDEGFYQRPIPGIGRGRKPQ